MAKVKVYPYVVYTSKGEFHNINVQPWAPYGKEAEVGGTVSKEIGSIYIHLAPIEVEVVLPAMEELEQRAVKILRAHKDSLRAEHYAMMTKLQFTENCLLRLANSDILDAEDKS